MRNNVTKVFTITDSLGNIYTGSTTVTLQNKAWLNSLLTNKWNGMKTALLSGDIEGALGYFVDDRYRQQFTEMGNADIGLRFASITEVRFDTVVGPIAQYWALRTEAEGTFAYPITYVQGENGMWKIMGF